MLDIARQLSGAEVIDFKTRYKGEVASQYFKVDVNMDFSKINKFPNLNKICEAGARMYWELGFSEENTEIKVASTVGVSKIIEIGADFDIDRTVHVNGNINYVSGLALSKIIEIR